MSTEVVERNGVEGEAEPTRGRLQYRPNVDIVEHADEIRILAEMPGVTSDKVEIQFKDGTLTIHGKVAPRQKGDERYLSREYGVADFHREFRVSESIDASKISADYADGVLTVHLPKVEAVKPRTIPINS